MLFWASVAPSGIAEGTRTCLTKTRDRKRVSIGGKAAVALGDWIAWEQTFSEL